MELVFREWTPCSAVLGLPIRQEKLHNFFILTLQDLLVYKYPLKSLPGGTKEKLDENQNKGFFTGSAIPKL